MSDLGGLEAARRSLLRVPAAASTVDLCGPCLQVLPVDGAAVPLMNGSAQHETLCASDPVAERIDELQFDLGEGPCWQALDTGRAVLVPDVRGVEHPAWPLFGAAAGRTDAAAIFAFPVRMGGIDLGAMDLYTTRPGPLPDDAVRAAAALADTLAWAVMRHLVEEDGGYDTDLGPGYDPPTGPGQDLVPVADGGAGTHPVTAARLRREAGATRREVHQAVGMVLAQVGTTPEGAYSLLRARAFAEDRTVRSVATDVLARRLSFA